MKQLIFILSWLALVPFGLAQDFGGYAGHDTPTPITAGQGKAGLTVPESVKGAVGAPIHVQAGSPAKAFAWIPSDGLELYVPALAMMDQSQCIIKASKAGAYKLWCVACLGDRQAVKVTVVLVGDVPDPAPGPGPGPIPGPIPDPTPNPAPIPKFSKLYVVVIENTAIGAINRGKVFSDPTLNAYMKQKGHGWRIVDKDVVGPDGKTPADVAPYIKLAAGKSLPQMFLVTDTGVLLPSFWPSLPTTPEEVLAILKKVGG